MTLAWNGVLGSRKAWTGRLLASVLPHRFKLARRTTRQLLAVMCWSFNVMLTGLYPSHDHRGLPFSEDDPRREWSGRPLAEGWRAGCVELRGDWAFQASVYGVPHWTSDHMCHMCAASKSGPLHYTDFRRRPTWRFRRISHNLFMQLMRQKFGDRICPLFLMRGFHRDMVRTCSMHSLNLGFGEQVNGGCLRHLLDSGFYGDVGRLPLQARLHLAWADFRRWAKDNHVTTSQPRFTVSKLNARADHDVPALSSKAYNSRVVTAYLAEACAGAQIANNTEEGLLVAGTAWGLAACYRRMERAPRFMTDLQAQSVETAGMLSLQCFSALARRALLQNRPRWIFKPKMHRIHHLLQDMRQTRPRLMLPFCAFAEHCCTR